MKLVALLLAIIMLIPAALIGGNLILRETTGADIISTAVYSYWLTEEVDVGAVCPNAITQQDMLNTQRRVNDSITRMIAYSAIDDKFNINFGLEEVNIKNTLLLTGTEVASLAQMIIMQEDLGQIEIGEGMYIDIQMKSADFDVVDPYNTRINAVMSIDVAPLKNSIKASLNGQSAENTDAQTGESTDSESSSGLNNIVDMIPDILYISSTFILEQTGGFSFNIYHEELIVNDLTNEQTETIFATINLFSDVGTAEDVNIKIATALATALIGNENERGLAYSLVPLGVTSFDFTSRDGVTYFTLVQE